MLNAFRSVSGPVGLVVCAGVATLGVVMFDATGDTRGTSLLPDVDFPVGNEFSEEKRVLGKLLFWDEQLSADNTVSCGTCHQHTSAGADRRLGQNPGLDGIDNTDDDIIGSPGVLASDANNDYVSDATFGTTRQVTGRSANPVINAAFFDELFWDGRASEVFMDPDTDEPLLVGFAALESQAVGPPLSSVEMAHAERDWGQISEKLRTARPMALGDNLPTDMQSAVLAARTYPELFRQAFGDSEINAARIGMAIATYERTLISDQTPWDLFIQGDPFAMTAAEGRGWNAFQTSFCTLCHTPPMFTDGFYRNIGLRPVTEDPGRQAVTGDPFDAGEFKSPQLRNVGLKRTFMHNGMFQTLEEVVNFYARVPGTVQFPENIDVAIPNLNIPPNRRADLVAFLETGLTDPRVEAGVFPFDSPDLFFGPGGSNNPMLLGGSLADSSGFTPRMIAVDPPLMGSESFRLGLTQIEPGASAVLVISQQPPVGGEVIADEVLGPFIASDPDGNGAVVTAHWPIPFSPARDGQVYFMQWRVEDPGQTEDARSMIARVELFCGFGECQTGCPADLTGEGTINFLDLSTFLTAFNAQEPEADFAPPAGVFNFFDLGEFLNAFNLGCP